MALISAHDPWVLAFGILGNIVSFIVFLAPVPTFVRICKKKSTEGYQSLPYLVTLFSATLWIYYAMLKSGAFLLITINAFGCVIETVYLVLFLIYAHKKARITAVRILLLMNLGGSCLVLLIIQVLTKGPKRGEVLGWICVAFSVSVFAAPLSIMRLVIRTKSVEFMPFHLSFFLFISAIVWLLYGIFLKDLCVMLPNVVGLVFGILQMALYASYRNYRKSSSTVDQVQEPVRVPEKAIDISKLRTVLESDQTNKETDKAEAPDNDADLTTAGKATSFVQKEQDHTKFEA